MKLKARVGLLSEALSVHGADVYVAGITTQEASRLRFAWEVEGTSFCLVPIAPGTADAAFVAFSALPFSATRVKALAKVFEQRGNNAARKNAANAAGLLVGFAHSEVSGTVVIGGEWATWNRE